MQNLLEQFSREFRRSEEPLERCCNSRSIGGFIRRCIEPGIPDPQKTTHLAISDWWIWTNTSPFAQEWGLNSPATPHHRPSPTFRYKPLSWTELFGQTARFCVQVMLGF